MNQDKGIVVFTVTGGILGVLLLITMLFCLTLQPGVQTVQTDTTDDILDYLMVTQGDTYDDCLDIWIEDTWVGVLCPTEPGVFTNWVDRDPY